MAEEESLLVNVAAPEFVHVSLCGLDLKVFKDRRIVPQAQNLSELIAQSAESTWLIHLLVKELIARGVLKELLPPGAAPTPAPAPEDPAPVPSVLDAIDPSERETVREPKT